VRLALAVLLALLAGPARGQFGTPPLVAELSQARLEITTAFAGASIIVFGATEELIGPRGDEVLVQAVGPALPIVVRRKERVLGIWVNGASARFAAIPGYYALAGTRAVVEMLAPEERREARLGLDMLPLRTSEPDIARFRAALVGLKQGAGLWFEQREPVQVSGGRLFHARLPLPATVAPGDYQVSVLLVRRGRIVARQELSLIVARTGTAAQLADVSRTAPVLYGLACVLLAAFAGWVGSVLFRRG
jgi:uncharacterized protein (TIGR02186 family)